MGFTCPRCGMTSGHPEDERHGYCGNCHDWTAPVAPSNVGRMHDLIVHVFAEVDVTIKDRDTTIYAALMVLDSHQLLRDFPAGETAASYHERVKRVTREALRQATGDTG